MAARCLITGGAGFLGRHVARGLADAGFDVGVAGRMPDRPRGGFEPRIEVFRVSLPDDDLGEVLDKFRPEILIHAASTASVGRSVSSPLEDFRGAVEVCAHTLEALRVRLPESRFLLLSSAAVYGDVGGEAVAEGRASSPLSPYAYHKLLCELLVEEYSRLHGLSTAVLRIFSAYGEGLRRQVVYDLAAKFLDGETGTVDVIGTGEESRDFVHAEDVAQAIQVVIDSGAEGIFNVGSGRTTRIADLVQALGEAAGGEKAVRFLGSTRRGDPAHMRADIGRLRALGFEPRVDLEEGTRRVVRWLAGSPAP